MNKKKETHRQWKAPELPREPLTTGDMPGDKIHIGSSHIKRAETLFPQLLQWLKKQNRPRLVLSVYGGSGVGKSEIASLLAYYLKESGYPSYILSGDNYPFRFPEENDTKRIEIFEAQGLDSLERYLGSTEEIDFADVNRIVREFKEGTDKITLKHMGRNRDSIEYREHSFKGIPLLILEWTHGNSPLLEGVDFPIFLYSTPEETLEHRLQRARDKEADSTFVKKVLEIEQAKLDSQAPTAALIIDKHGKVYRPEVFTKRKG